MSDPTNDPKLNDVPNLVAQGIFACIRTQFGRQSLKIEDASDAAVFLSPHQARLLRDWLNLVLP